MEHEKAFDDFFTERNLLSKTLSRLHLGGQKRFLVFKKIIFFTVITWLPLLLFSLFEGNFINTSVKIPFLKDIATNAKFLIAFPVLFLAESTIRNNVREALIHFIESGIISENNVVEFNSFIKRYSQLYYSRISEILIFLLAYSGAVLVWGSDDSDIFASSWKYVSADGSERTIAGFWSIWVSIPIFQYLLFRMLWVYILWIIYIWKISRMNLNLLPTLPDNAGGLTFLNFPQLAFGMLGMIQAITNAARMANQILYLGVPIEDFKTTVLIAVPVAVIFYSLPMIFFMKKLIKLKVDGLYEYNILGVKYSSLFYNKWIKNINRGSDELLGTSDIQSLADFAGSYEIIEKMRFLPFRLNFFVILFLMISLPFALLYTIQFPINEIVKVILNFFL